MSRKRLKTPGLKNMLKPRTLRLILEISVCSGELWLHSYTVVGYIEWIGHRSLLHRMNWSMKWLVLVTAHNSCVHYESNSSKLYCKKDMKWNLSMDRLKYLVPMQILVVVACNEISFEERSFEKRCDVSSLKTYVHEPEVKNESGMWNSKRSYVV